MPHHSHSHPHPHHAHAHHQPHHHHNHPKLESKEKDEFIIMNTPHKNHHEGGFKPPKKLTQMYEEHCISPKSFNQMGGNSNNIGNMRSGSPRRVYSPRPLL